MTAEQALAFFVFSVVAAGTPGPSNALLTATGANVGVRRGLPALFGVGAGMGLMMFLVAFGLGSVILGNPLVLTIVKWCGAAVLLWLAWKIATAHGASTTTGGKPVGFFGAAAFQWVNPKSWLICTSAAATYLDQRAGSALGQSIAFAVTFVVAALPSIFPWLAFGAVMQRWLRSDRSRRIFNGAMGVLLAASVLLIIR
ncbi:MAG TPA: LysE family translocator [Ktedonobacterales bacterium]|nr:LysE family translocator [Ktedonobacterales bacterium]